MEAFECGTEACLAGRAASGALDSDLGHRAVLPLTCGLFGCMACMSVTQRRQRTTEEPLVGQGGLFHVDKPTMLIARSIRCDS